MVRLLPPDKLKEEEEEEEASGRLAAGVQISESPAALSGPRTMATKSNVRELPGPRLLGVMTRTARLQPGSVFFLPRGSRRGSATGGSRGCCKTSRWTAASLLFGSSHLMKCRVWTLTSKGGRGGLLPVAGRTGAGKWSRQVHQVYKKVRRQRRRVPPAVERLNSKDQGFFFFF